MESESDRGRMLLWWFAIVEVSGGTNNLHTAQLAAILYIIFISSQNHSSVQKNYFSACNQICSIRSLERKKRRKELLEISATGAFARKTYTPFPYY